MTKRKPSSLVRVTLSGPMRGKPDWNYPQFHEVEQAWLDKHPFDVILNPAKNFEGRQDLPVPVYLNASLKQVLEGGIVVLLPGWEDSEGSRMEVQVGRATGKVFYLAERGIDYKDNQAVSSWEFEYAPPSELDGYLNFEHDPQPEDIMVEIARELEGIPGVRLFPTGATRDTEDGKLDYEAFLSPAVLRRYAEYMHQHRVRSDGSLRAGDDWQKGMPTDVYMKSMFRHFMDVWTRHRVGTYPDGLKAEALCGVLFNAMGYLHELEKRSEW